MNIDIGEREGEIIVEPVTVPTRQPEPVREPVPAGG